MKKLLVYLTVLMIVLIIFPSIFTKKRSPKTVDNEQKVSEVQENTEEIVKYDYSKFATVKLLHTKTNEIDELPIDEYLYGVVSGEMPASYEMEAIKAQAIVARTYTLYQIINSKGKHADSDICDNSNCCQAWISKEDRLNRWEEDVRDSNWNKITKAVDSTQGKIITYNNAPIDAFFHSNSGGVTETATNVWGGTNFPYLKIVETAGEDGYDQYSSEVEITKDELVSKLKEKYPEIEINFDEEKCIEIKEYTDSGRVRTIKFGNVQIAGTEARTLFGLKSTNFSIEINENKIKFKVIGYGHGVGMSQTGADSMAKTGSSFEQIIMHFYDGVQITYINDL